MSEYTIAEWMRVGPQIVAAGPYKSDGSRVTVNITNRHPCYFDDALSPDGAWGWQYGYRWLDPSLECSSWTLPRDVFLRLPQCPCETWTVGTMPRWNTEAEAISAMNTAAYEWAVAN